MPLERSCDRACLYGVLDGYLAALRRKDPWPGEVGGAMQLITENNVEMPVGEGHWGTITKLETYDLRVADPVTGQVVMFGALSESDDDLAVRRAAGGARWRDPPKRRPW